MSTQPLLSIGKLGIAFGYLWELLPSPWRWLALAGLATGASVIVGKGCNSGTTMPDTRMHCHDLTLEVDYYNYPYKGTLSVAHTKEVYRAEGIRTTAGYQFNLVGNGPMDKARMDLVQEDGRMVGHMTMADSTTRVLNFHREDELTAEELARVTPMLVACASLP